MKIDDEEELINNKMNILNDFEKINENKIKRVRSK